MERTEPLVLQLVGPPGVGKSTSFERFCHIYSQVAQRGPFEKSQLYVKDRGVYWEGYDPKSQPYIKFSELGNLQPDVMANQDSSQIDFFLNLASNDPASCEMAFEDKGKVMAAPDLLLLDTNFTFLNLSRRVAHIAPVMRRMVTIECLIHPEFRKYNSCELDPSKIGEATRDDIFYYGVTKYTTKPMFNVQQPMDPKLFEANPKDYLNMETEWMSATELDEVVAELCRERIMKVRNRSRIAASVSSGTEKFGLPKDVSSESGPVKLSFPKLDFLALDIYVSFSILLSLFCFMSVTCLTVHRTARPAIIYLIMKHFPRLYVHLYETAVIYLGIGRSMQMFVYDTEYCFIDVLLVGGWSLGYLPNYAVFITYLLWSVFTFIMSPDFLVRLGCIFLYFEYYGRVENVALSFRKKVEEYRWYIGGITLSVIIASIGVWYWICGDKIKKVASESTIEEIETLSDCGKSYFRVNSKIDTKIWNTVPVPVPVNYTGDIEPFRNLVTQQVFFLEIYTTTKDAKSLLIKTHGVGICKNYLLLNTHVLGNSDSLLV